MNKDWSDQNKLFQKQISNRKTFKQGIDTLLKLREELFWQISVILDYYPAESFYAMPYINADGFHNKTLAYSVWHIFRIEDIVCNELILKQPQVLFEEHYLERIGSPIITTGNELVKQQIAEFSKQLNIVELKQYAKQVMLKTNQYLQNMEYADLKKEFTEQDKQILVDSKCVSEADVASWLIDFWCNKDIKGLLLMPLSRHWIMHVEAMCRIKNRLCTLARKGVDPIAYCGFSCNHCFLAEYCGSCRTAYNTCSFATCSKDKVCPNVSCCKEKGYDGCYQCPDLEQCHKGFYIEGNDGAGAAKAQAMFIRKYGKKNFLKVSDELHRLYEFKKAQEILGQDQNEGFKLLEEAFNNIK